MIHSNDVLEAVRTGEPTKKDFLIDGKMSHPKGLSFSPGYSQLYVSNADPNDAYWKVFDVNRASMAHKGRIFYNVSAEGKPTEIGSPGGIKTDIMGNLHASGPGGVLILDTQALLVGKLKLDREATGLAFESDGMLYITAEDLLLRKRLGTQPSKQPSSARK